MEPLQAEAAFRQVARRLAARCQLFDEVRAVLRLDRAPSHGDSRHSDNPAETAETAAAPS